MNPLTCKKCGGPAAKVDGIRGDNVVEVAACLTPKCNWQQAL